MNGDDLKARLRGVQMHNGLWTLRELAGEAADRIEALEAENQKLAYAALKAEAEVERLRDWIQDIRSPRNLGADR